VADRAAQAETNRAGQHKVGRTPKQTAYNLALTDPAPLAAVSTLWRTAAQASTIAMAVIVTIAALYFARPVLLPVTTAVVIGLMLGPLTKRADRAKIHPLLTAIVLWFGVCGVLYGVIVLLSQPIGDWIGKAPEIATNLSNKVHLLDRPREALESVRKALAPDNKDAAKVSVDMVGVAQSALLYVTPAIGELVVFFGTLFFYLAGRIQLRHVMVVFFDSREARLRMLKIISDVESNLTSYLSLVAIINAVVGIAAGVIAYFVGLPNAVAWGVLAFLLNFIPYIGAVLMELVLFGVGLVTFPSLTHAMLAPLLYLGFSTLEGHFITPSIMGRRLTLNPLTVFLSLVFWSWLWGPVGAFLAVPIVIVMLVVSSHLFGHDEPSLPS